MKNLIALVCLVVLSVGVLMGALDTNTVYWTTGAASNTLLATNGFVSFATNLVTGIATNGWTNTQSINMTFHASGTNLTYKLLSSGGATLWTNVTGVTEVHVTLQPGMAINFVTGTGNTNNVAIGW